jgi:hypothetical protein
LQRDGTQPWCSIEQAFAALPFGGFNENLMAQLGDIDSYQNSRRLHNLNNGHSWFGS